MNKTEVKEKLKDNKLPEGWKRIRLTAGKSFILGYTDEQFGICKNLPVIIFDDFTTDSRYINFPFKLKSSAIKILKTRDNEYNLFFIYNVMQNLNFKPGSGHKRFWISEYSKISIPYPPLPEQQKIVEILETVDETIDKTDAIIEKYKRIKQGLMQELLTRGITAFEFEKDKLIAAVKKVFDSEDHRFGREENLVSHLSRYLEDFFSEWDVDSEVEKNNERQRPDIIIHKRGTDKNLFAIEVKKNYNLNAIKEDIKKLEHVMLGDYQYEDAVFIGFDIDNFEDVFKLSEKVNFILVSKNGETKVKSRVRNFNDSPFGNIPAEWEVIELGKSEINIIDGDRGVNYPKLGELSKEGHCLFLNNKNIENGKIIFTECQYITKEKNLKLGSGKVRQNDIILTTRGTVGNIAFISNKSLVARINSGMVILRNYKKLLSPIFFIYLWAFIFKKSSISLSSGSAQPQLPIKDLITFEFIVPSFPEQQRIASILSQIDETIEKEQKYKEKLERIKQGLMEDLLTGKVRVNHLIKEGVESV
jgi:restriction endonuclease S subunit